MRSTSSARLTPSGRGELEITDVLNFYIPDGRLFWREYKGHWSDAGTIDSLLRAGQLGGRGRGPRQARFGRS